MKNAARHLDSVVTHSPGASPTKPGAVWDAVNKRFILAFQTNDEVRNLMTAFLRADGLALEGYVRRENAACDWDPSIVIFKSRAYVGFALRDGSGRNKVYSMDLAGSDWKEEVNLELLSNYGVTLVASPDALYAVSQQKDSKFIQSQKIR